MRTVVGLLAVAAVGRLTVGFVLTDWCDLEVYRRAAREVFAGVSPYLPGERLPFTYPPFAAVVFAPLAWLSARTAGWLYAVSCVALLAVVIAVVARRLGWSDRWIPLWLMGSVMLAPVDRHLGFGQVGIPLMAMVVLDVFVVPARHRGLLIGVAAAIKVVPGAFVLLFVCRRDWATVRRAALGWVVATGVGMLAAPADTIRYYTHELWDTGRVGGASYPDNQSLTGVLARILDTETPPRWATAVLLVLGLALGVAACRRQLGRGDELSALLALALGILLASPVSWSHHWVWVVPVVMVAWARRGDWRGAGSGFGGGRPWWGRAPHPVVALNVGALIVGALIVEPLWLAQVCPWRPGVVVLTAILPVAAVATLCAAASDRTRSGRSVPPVRTGKAESASVCGDPVVSSSREVIGVSG